MDFVLQTKRGKKEFKNVFLTIRNYYDLKKAGLPLEKLDKISEDENGLAIAEMLEIILKKYGVEKGDLTEARMSAQKDIIEAFVNLTQQEAEELKEFENSDGDETAGE